MTPPRKNVYLDHNATTPIRPEVLEAMLPYLSENFGNPNSTYFFGQKARKAVELAREEVAALLGASDAQEIVFTSCGSESDVLAISGAAWAAWESSSGAQRHIVSSRVEHDAVRGILGLLSRRGFSVDCAGVDARGLISAEEVEKLISPSTSVVSIMHANNEVGTIEPIEEIAALCRARGVLFHTDAVQSAGKIPINASKMGLDMLSISGHKLNAPKGIGALFVRRGVKLSPLITGHQEKNRRGGTENVASIVGLGRACVLAKKELESSKSSDYEGLRDKLVSAVLKIPDSRLNGHPTLRLPHCAHFSFKGLDGHHLVVALDQEGIAISSGPACSAGSSTPSHVLSEMGLPNDVATGSLRVSLGWSNTEEDIDRFLQVLPRTVEKIRLVKTVA